MHEAREHPADQQTSGFSQDERNSLQEQQLSAQCVFLKVGEAWESGSLSPPTFLPLLTGIHTVNVLLILFSEAIEQMNRKNQPRVLQLQSRGCGLGERKSLSAQAEYENHLQSIKAAFQTIPPQPFYLKRAGPGSARLFRSSQ